MAHIYQYTWRHIPECHNPDTFLEAFMQLNSIKSRADSSFSWFKKPSFPRRLYVHRQGSDTTTLKVVSHEQ